MKSTENPIYGLIGFALPLAAVVLGGILVAISWSSVSEVMAQTSNVISFVFGVVMVITGVVFYSGFVLVRKYGIGIN